MKKSRDDDYNGTQSVRLNAGSRAQAPRSRSPAGSSQRAIRIAGGVAVPGSTGDGGARSFRPVFRVCAGGRQTHTEISLPTDHLPSHRNDIRTRGPAKIAVNRIPKKMRLYYYRPPGKDGLGKTAPTGADRNGSGEPGVSRPVRPWFHHCRSR
jgi:hypothetical protein